MLAKSHPLHARSRTSRLPGSVEGNERLTASIALVLLVLLFVEGLTVVSVQQLLTWHVFIGLLLIPPVAIKVASTSWRFFNYYAGAQAYVRNGPPKPLLRLLGPVVVVLTIILFATGIALIVVAPHSLRPQLLQWHRLSFIAWFAVMAVHVLAHLGETVSIAPRDWFRRTRRQVDGASARVWTLSASLAVGLVGALWLTPYAAHWRF